MKSMAQRALLLEKLVTSSRFTAGRIGLNEALQGVLLKGDKENLHIYSTNLSSYYHAVIPFKAESEIRAVVDTKKIIEFISLLDGEQVEAEFERNQIRFTQGKTTGTFPFVNQEDFPLPPEVKEKGQTIKSSFFLKYIPLVLFSASKDESRPALNGVNFVDMDTEMGIVSTDGFRLSLLKTKKEEAFGPMLIPSGFLYEILKYMRDEHEVSFYHSQEEKIVLFRVGGDEFYTRLIDGEFPPFERVIPAEKKTTVLLDRDELLTKIKLVSIFAREASNIVVCEFSKRGLIMRPKTEGGKENLTQLDITIDGEDQAVAFNYRFVLDFLNNMSEKKIEVEILRSDAPVVFKVEGRKDFIHIIMPVRIQE